ncbi:MAG: CAP domain-containing protein [bacterium]|nr:CAP domain-containing protein [bacterium]
MSRSITIGCLFLLGLLYPSDRSDGKSNRWSREPEGLAAAIRENNSQPVLREFLDSDVTLRLKLAQLDYINVQRKKHGVKPLQYDVVAGRVMQSHIAEMTQARSFAHQNRNGEYAFHRFAKSGRTDHVQENLFAVFTTGVYQRSNEEFASKMREGVDAFLAEIPPNDGHRKALLDPNATHVGIGFAQANDDQSFRYGELFVHKYVELARPPVCLTSRDTLEIIGRMIDLEYGPYAFFGYWTPPLKTPSRADTFTDKPYFDGSSDAVIQRWPWDFQNYKPLGETFSLRIPLHGIQPGLIYGVLHVKNQISTIPYRIGGKATSEGTVSAGAIVIEIIE